MDLIWTVISAIAFVAWGAIAVFYFFIRSNGKSYAAVSATSIIGSIWTGYASILTLNWPVAIVAAITGEKLESVQTSWIIAGIAAVVALVSSWIIYKITTLELRKNRLPLNASAREIEEPGRNAGILELAFAHARYRVAGKPDKPLGNPGEDPYGLPPVPHSIDWPTLAADLLVQFEPNLLRDSFTYIHERKFFKLTANDAFQGDRSITWIIWPVEDTALPTNLSAVFDAPFAALPATDLKYVACVRSQARRDETFVTSRGLSVRVLSLATLIEESLNFGQYAAALIRRFEQRPVPGASYSLKDCFAPPRVRPVPPSGGLGTDGSADDKELDLLRLLEDWSDQPGVDHLSIVGEFGQGKSTALLAFCCNWARRWAGGERQARIPLLIELRGKSPKRQAPDGFLAEWGHRYGLRGEALLSLVQAGRAILIFEGFDEVQDAGLKLDRFEQFKALWSFSYPEAKIVFTGRPNFFLDTEEREKLLRNSRAARDAGLENSQILSLSFLDEPAISAVLSKYPPDTRGEILEACRRDPAFFDIAKRPSMLPVIGNQWSRIRNQVASNEGITSAAIIKHFIDFLYARKEADSEKLGQYQLLHHSVRHYFTQHVAWRMMKQQLRNTIDKGAFVLAIEKAYETLDAEFRIGTNEDPAIATSIRRMLERFKDRPKPDLIAAIVTDVRTNGILVPDPAGGRDNLYFPHKQYFEFILGEVFVRGLQRKQYPNSWTSRLKNRELVDAATFEPVTLFFGAGLLTPSELADKKNGGVVWWLVRCLGGFGVTLTLGLRRIVARKNAHDGIARMVVSNSPLIYRSLYSRDSRTTGWRDPVSRWFTLALSGATLASASGMARSFGEFFVIDTLRLDLVDVVLLTFFALTTVLFFSRRFTFDLAACVLCMQIYRFGQVRAVTAERKRAALTLLIARSLPVGAPSFSRSTLLAAATLLKPDATGEILQFVEGD